MTPNVVLVSRNVHMSATRANALSDAGYRTIHIHNLMLLETLCSFDSFRTLVLDDTINAQQREAIVEILRSRSSAYRVLCVDPSTSLKSLLRMCQDLAGSGVSVSADVALPTAS
jgi:hypothetical protein